MNKSIITTILCVLMTLSGIKALAYDISAADINGNMIYYNFINDKTELSVTYLKTYPSSNGKGSLPYSNYSGNIVIPDHVEYQDVTYKVTAIGYYAFYKCSNLTSIVIPNCVISIDGNAFENCTNLSSVIFPNNLTSIGNMAFYGCSGLTSIIIPNNVITIGGQSFKMCTNLTSVIIGNSVESIGFDAFYGCNKLTSITIPSSVTSMDNSAFRNCDNLKTIYLYPERIGDWFKGFKSIEEIIVGDEVVSISASAFEGTAWYESKPDGLIYAGNVVYKYKGEMPENTNIVLNEGTLGIAESAFYNCKNLNSIVFPNTLKCIEGYAFQDCTGLQEIAIPHSVTTIGNGAFYGCSGLISLTIPSCIVSLGASAFRDCTGLTSLVIPESVEDIGNYAFTGCPNLTSVTINSDAFLSKDRPSTWNSKQKKYVYSSLKDVFGDQVVNYILGEGITRIGKYAFEDCSNLLSINIPKSLKSIGEKAFNGCTGLKKVIIPDIAAWCAVLFDKYGGEYNSSNPLLNAKHIYSDENTEITNLVIPDGVTCIENMVFINCDGITSVKIPGTVTIIKEFAFMFCDGLTSVVIPEGVTDFTSAFWNCANLESITLPNTLTRFDSNAFHNCPSLTNVNIPNSVSRIERWAFWECPKIASLIFPDNITFIGNEAFNLATKLYCHNNTSTLLALWAAGYTPYLIGTETLLESPSVSVVSSTQTSATLKINNYQDGYTYSYNGKKIEGDIIVLKNLFPELKTTSSVGMSIGEVYPVINQLYFELTTEPISPTIDVKKTATSAEVSVSYIKGDAEVTSQRLVMNPSYVSDRRISGGTDVDDLQYHVSGLDPNQSVGSFIYEIIVSNGSTTQRYCTNQIYVNTDALMLETLQPKVVTVGNVIVAADSNLDDEEENVGFEWRRTDWTDDFASNTGKAALFEGRMEGYIRNMNAEKLWKYRPYYLSNTGTYYYGDWVGLDPSNTSYFEPTVHTYDKTVIEGNTALVKGYALTGTDKITVQGFKYWKETSGARSMAPSISIPSNAMTVEASGQVMTATFTNLDFGTTYNFLSFVTTSEGETFYGEMKEFTTSKKEISGDVNGDGAVDIADAVCIVNYVVGKANTTFVETAADVNGDGVVDIADAVKIVNIVVGKD